MALYTLEPQLGILPGWYYSHVKYSLTINMGTYIEIIVAAICPWMQILTVDIHLYRFYLTHNDKPSMWIMLNITYVLTTINRIINHTSQNTYM